MIQNEQKNPQPIETKELKEQQIENLEPMSSTPVSPKTQRTEFNSPHIETLQTPSLKPQHPSLMQTLFPNTSPRRSPPPNTFPPHQSVPAPVDQLQKQSIMKVAQMQRISGTHQFFLHYLNNYLLHSQRRRNVVVSICLELGRRSREKQAFHCVLKEYFQDYSSLCKELHEKSYKYTLSERQNQSVNKLINIREELKSGSQRLLSVRKNVGNGMAKVEKLINNKTIPDLSKAFEMYNAATQQQYKKLKVFQDQFTSSQKQFTKRVQKLTKIYSRGSVGINNQQDIFIEMTKYIHDEQIYNQNLYKWSVSSIAYSKTCINAEYNLLVEVETTLHEFKTSNNAVNSLSKRKDCFKDNIKRQILENYIYEKLCLPVDTDYVRMVLQMIDKNQQEKLRNEDYQQFLQLKNVEMIVGKPSQVLKGSITHTFKLQNQNEEIIKTVCGNLVHYNRKLNEVKGKVKVSTTKAVPHGNGTVLLQQTIPGIIFDSHNEITLQFSDDNRAEQFTIHFSQQLPGADEQ